MKYEIFIQLETIFVMILMALISVGVDKKTFLNGSLHRKNDDKMNPSLAVASGMGGWCNNNNNVDSQFVHNNTEGAIPSKASSNKRITNKSRIYAKCT
jgi:hypothetical protein